MLFCDFQRLLREKTGNTAKRYNQKNNSFLIASISKDDKINSPIKVEMR